MVVIHSCSQDCTWSGNPRVLLSIGTGFSSGIARKRSYITHSESTGGTGIPQIVSPSIFRHIRPYRNHIGNGCLVADAHIVRTCRPGVAVSGDMIGKIAIVTAPDINHHTGGTVVWIHLYRKGVVAIIIIMIASDTLGGQTTGRI